MILSSQLQKNAGKVMDKYEKYEEEDVLFAQESLKKIVSHMKEKVRQSNGAEN